MKTPNIFSRGIAAAALVAISAMTLPLTADARDDWRYDRDRGRGWGYNHGYRNYGGPGRPIYYSRTRSLNASVQRALAMRGYYHGPADGDIGPGTRRAIVRYQLEHRLPPTGRIDGLLLRSLRLD